MMNNNVNFFDRWVNNLQFGNIITERIDDIYDEVVVLRFAHSEIANDFRENIMILTGVDGNIQGNAVTYTNDSINTIRGIVNIFEQRFTELELT